VGDRQVLVEAARDGTKMARPDARRPVRAQDPGLPFRLLLALSPDRGHVLARSIWRRRHQACACSAHYPAETNRRCSISVGAHL
jgi:hypothetical protein